MLAPVLCCANSRASETWFIDLIKYHISAHGQLSCQDCHADKLAKQDHPNASDVSKNVQHFFHSDLCFNCHDGDEIKSALAKGFHGGKPVKKGYNYDNCIACHDPHYQPGLKKKLSSSLGTALKNQKLCSSCHPKKDSLPVMTADDLKCLQCHEKPGLAYTKTALNVNHLCLTCHGSNGSHSKSTTVLRIDKTKHCSKGHQSLTCLSCHSDAAAFPHNQQMAVQCTRCHTPHDEAILHDAHSRVSCKDCHLSGVKLSLDPVSKKIVWHKIERPSDVSPINVIMPSAGTTSCSRCHTRGNQLGAPAMVPPAKGIICMPCHTATFTITDPVTLIALLGFAIGIFLVASVWFSARTQPKIDKRSSNGHIPRSPLFARVLAGARGLLLDGLLQRRLFRRSHFRWFVHSLIFWPFIIRFSWGLVGLLGSLFWPSNPYIWKMLDKNNPVTAILFDVTGLSILVGIALAISVKRRNNGSSDISRLPERDWLAMVLLGLIVVTGFVVEGARIALTGAANFNHFAFFGIIFSYLWAGVSNLSQIYGYLWYLHAALTALFVIYLPFSRMLHIIIAPMVAAWNSIEATHSGHF
ncbi:MAG: cytochrome c3 family protein [Desulfomonilaceae bacterium]